MDLKNKVAKNALWIIGCRIAQSVFQLVINMFTARYLGPSNYGLISYAASIVAFLTPLMSIGISNILVNEIIKNPKKEGETLGTTLTLTFLSSLLCVGGMAAFVSIANAGETETLIVCVLYSIILIFQSLEIIQYWFQAKYLAKYTSIVSLSAYIIVSAYKIILLISGKSVYWFAVSNAFDFCLIAISLLVIYKIVGGQPFKFSLKTAKHLVNQSRYYIISSLMITVFAEIGKVILKIMNSNAEVGFYSAAVTIAGITSFVFVAIIDSMRPMILEHKSNGNTESYKRNFSRLCGIVIYLSLAQSIVIALLAKYVVLILYGGEYLPAVSALRIIVWYTTFSYLGSVRNVWILAEGKQKYLWVINLCGAIANILLNFILIPFIGINGAALASLATQIFANVILSFIIKPLREVNSLMIKGLNPKLYIKK